jgi:VanZ family protein
MKNPKAILIYIIPLIAYAILILYLSVLPVGNEPPPSEPPAEVENTSFVPAESKPAETMLYAKYNIPFFDLIANIVLYIPLGFLLFKFFNHYYPGYVERKNKERTEKDLKYRILFLAIIISVLYSILVETAQTQITSRIADIHDILNNYFGAMIGALIPLHKELHKEREKLVNQLKTDK